MRHATREPGLGARAGGPHPRRQARFPGDAGQRPALPGVRSLRASTPGLGARTRRNKARRWCSPGPRAPARIRAARRGSPGMRASGPCSQGLVPCERPPRASVRGRAGNKARRRCSPGARAAGPHPRRQARLPGDAGQRPALPGLVPRERSTRGSGARCAGDNASPSAPGRGREGTRRAVGPRRERGVPARQTVRRNQPNSPATSSRSSTSSASVISSLARLNSSTLKPSTMRQSPPAQVTGKEKITPSAMP